MINEVEELAKKLYLEHCEKIKMVPWGWENLPSSLQYVWERRAEQILGV